MERSDDTVLADTRRWIEKAVIGLNLCPFARAVYVKNQVRIVVSRARHVDAFLDDLDRELDLLVNTPAQDIEAYEAGQREVPVSFLYALAKATGVDLTALITGSEAKLHQYSLVKKGQGLSVSRRKAYKYQSLAYRFSRPGMEPFLVTVPPRARTRSAPTMFCGATRSICS